MEETRTNKFQRTFCLEENNLNKEFQYWRDFIRRNGTVVIRVKDGDWKEVAWKIITKHKRYVFFYDVDGDGTIVANRQAIKEGGQLSLSASGEINYYWISSFCEEAFDLSDNYIKETMDELINLRRIA